MSPILGSTTRRTYGASKMPRPRRYTRQSSNKVVES